MGAQVLLRRPGPLPWSFAYAPRGPVLGDVGRGGHRAVHRARPGAAQGRGPAEPPADRPRDRARRRPRRGRPGDRRAGGRGLAAGDGDPAGLDPRRSTCAADEDALWGDLRKKWRQYVNKARTGGVRDRRRRARAARRVLRDLPRDGGPGRVPHPRASRPTSDVWQAYAPGRPRAAAVRRAARRHARRDAVPRPRRDPGRGAVRRHDPGRRRQPRELPAQVGGDPQLARAGRRRRTTCGASRTPGSRTSRRASAGARSTTSARTTSCSTRSGGGRTPSPRPRASGSSGCATASRAASSASGYAGDGGGDGGDA